MKRIVTYVLLAWLISSLTACQLLPDLSSSIIELRAGTPTRVNQSETTLGDNYIVVPADWLLYQARDDAFGFFHPPNWTIGRETATGVTLAGRFDEAFQVSVMDALCGIGDDDVSQEDVMSCLAWRGSLASGVSGGGSLFSKELLLYQGHWVYGFAYGASQAEDASASSRQYLLVMALPNNQMLIGLYRAAVLGPRTRQELQLLMASYFTGALQAQRITATPQPSSAVAVTYEPEVTVAPGATAQPAVVPGDWLSSTCIGCRVSYYRPSTWKLLQEDSDNMLWQAEGNGLVVVGVGAAPCTLLGADHENNLSCLADGRASQAPENAEYYAIDSGIYEQAGFAVYWIAYHSSTPDDSRPLYGLVLYKLLEDHRMLTVEYANIARAPTIAEQIELFTLADSARLTLGSRVTPTPSPEPTATPVAGEATPTIAWNAPVRHIIYE